MKNSITLFRRLCILCCAALTGMLLPGISRAQVSAYTFSQTTIPFVTLPPAGSTLIASGTVDNVTVPFSWGFAIPFNGATFTSCYVSSNGFISLGTVDPGATNFLPIPGAGAYGNVISAMGRDMIGASATASAIRAYVTGTAPNRQVTFQYLVFRMNGVPSLGSNSNFQIVLNENGVVEVRYGGNVTLNTSVAFAMPEVGLRGNTPADFNNRFSVTSWSLTTPGPLNGSTVRFTLGIFPPSGLVFRWTPPPTPCPEFTLNAGCTPVTHSSSTAGAGNDCSFGASNDRTYAINLPTAGTWVISTCSGTSYDTYLYLSSSCCGGSLLASNDNACGVQSEITYTGGPGTVYVAVEGATPASDGAYTLTVREVTPPTVVCNNVSVNLSASGTASLTLGALGSASDACGIASFAASILDFTCEDVSDCPTDLFISEYIEGSSNNKCIEIYNGTGAAVNLAAGGYVLRMYFNGSSSAGLTIPLTGTVANGDVYVVCQSAAASAFLAQADQTSAAGWYNGDDAVTLEKAGGLIVDIAGQIGCDPGTQWSVGANSTLDRTLRRKSPVHNGIKVNPSGACSISSFATLGAEWDGFPVDNSAGLGAHTFTGCAGTSVTLTAVDNNGNSASCIATVTVRDATPPVLTCPAPITVQCGSPTDPSVTGTASATDVCGTATISYTDVVSLTGCNGTGAILRTWRAYDAQGNMSSCTQTITVIDNTAPSIVVPASGLTLECGNPGNFAAVIAWISGRGGASATDNCGAVAWSNNYSGILPDCGTTGSATVVFTASDACGNSSSTSAVLTIQDTQAPVLSLPGSITIPCGTPTDPLTLGSATATDVCSDATPTVVFINEFHYDNAGADAGEFIEIAGTAGTNLAGFSLVLYNGADGLPYTTVPVSGIIPLLGGGFGVLSFPVSSLQNGSPDGIALVAGGSAVLEFISYEGAFTALGGPAAGRLSVDVGVAELGADPLGTSLQRTGAVSGANLSGLSWTGPAAASPGSFNTGETFSSGVVPVAISHSDVFLPGCGGYTGTITRTWTATDACGNADTDVQTITIIDNIAPTITCPENETAKCYYDIPAPQPTVATSDNCDPSPVVTNGGDVIISGSGCFGDPMTVERVYVATDACGNVATCKQYFTVEADPLVVTLSSPVFACGYNISCNGAMDGSVSASVSGGCAAYSYLWSTGHTTAAVTGLGAGNYSVVVTDFNGCTSTEFITLTQPDPLSVDAGSNATVYVGYPGFGCATLTGCCAAGGCAPYSYSWSTSGGPAGSGISINVCPTVSTTYYLTVTDANGCTFTDSAYVCAVDVVCEVAHGSVTKIQICHTPPATDMTMCVPVSAVPAHLGHGDYIGPCGSGGSGPDPCLFPGSAKYSAPAADVQREDIRMTAFPNPFSASTTVEFSLTRSESATVKVYNLTGVEVATLFSGDVMADQIVRAEFSAENLSSGVYFARLTTASGETRNLKMVYNR